MKVSNPRKRRVEEDIDSRHQESKGSRWRKERKVKIPLSPGDIEKLLGACRDERERRVIMIMLSTGMHPSVMADPEKYDMEITRGMLTWNRPKTGKLCRWLVPDEMKGLVDAFLNEDLGYHRSTYWNIVRRVAKRAGLEHVSPLTLRHTATIESLKEESPEQVLLKIRCSPGVLWRTYANITGMNNR